MKAIAEFRRRLKAGQICLGASVTLADPLVSDALADSVDFLWIDLEHSGMTVETVSRHVLAARGRGVPALVRVAGSDTPFIKPVLDAGADGIIVPQVRNAEEVTRVVADCRYPPAGRRGYGPRVPSNYGRDGGPAYVRRANRALFVSVQIETVEALEDLDRIAAIPGLDSLVIGPWDLSGALGVLGEVEHPKVIAAVETVIAKARDACLLVGAGMGINPEYASAMVKRGIQWLHVGCDCTYLVHCMDWITSSVRKQIGEPLIRR